MLIVNGQVNTDEEGALHFLSMSRDMFQTYRAAGTIRPVRRGLYNYQELVDAMRVIIANRDKVIHIHGEIDKDEKGTNSKMGPEAQELDGERDQSGYRQTKELLRGHERGSRS